MITKFNPSGLLLISFILGFVCYNYGMLSLPSYCGYFVFYYSYGML